MLARKDLARAVLLAAACAYALARLRFRRHKVLLGLIAIGSMVPIQIGLGPLFNTMLTLNLLDSCIPPFC